MIHKKQQLRSEMKKKMKDFKDLGLSDMLCNKLKQELFWKNARHVMLYAPIHGEVNVLSLFDTSKQFYFPRMKGDDIEVCEVKNVEHLESSTFGIFEPKQGCQIVDPNILDIILVPGMAFDLQGGRMGKGKGFYDRFLSQIQKTPEKPLFVSLAFDFQVVDNIPREKHDIPMDVIVTERLVQRF